MFQIKSKSEIKKWTKSLKEKQIKNELGDVVSEILIEHSKEIEKLRKQIQGILSSIEQMNKRIYELEMRE